jgi:hypothetical protein
MASIQFAFILIARLGPAFAGGMGFPLAPWLWEWLAITNVRKDMMFSCAWLRTLHHVAKKSFFSWQAVRLVVGSRQVAHIEKRSKR